MAVTLEPRLAKPGAGIPFFEWAVAKYLILPGKLKAANKELDLASFSKESEIIIKLANSITVSELSERKLIKRLRGIEDNSRFWSVAMTLQHLVIVGESVKELIIDLSNGGTQQPKAEIKNFKPSPDVNSQTIVDTFEQMSRNFLIGVEPIDINAFPKVTFEHPWFGPLNASGWLVIAGLHQRIHRHQIETIILQIGSDSTVSR